MNKKILVGSRAFFAAYPDFKSKDTDILTLVERGNGFNYVRQITTGDRCHFEFVRKPKAEMIDYALHHGAAMQVGKFLVKAFAEELALTVDDLKQLQPLIDKLDTKHQYERIIYDYIVESGTWDLSQEVLDAAYAAYKAARPQTSKHAKELDDPRHLTPTN